MALEYKVRCICGNVYQMTPSDALRAISKVRDNGYEFSYRFDPIEPFSLIVTRLEEKPSWQTKSE